MFEIELKFKVNQEQNIDLLKGATFIARESFHDVYYDYSDYRLSLNDIWLRSRNGAFLLKLPLKSTTYEALAVQKNRPKQEIEGLDQIMAELGIKNITDSLHQNLLAAGITALYSYDNVREKYRMGSMVLDLDKTTWSGHEFHMCEIEMVVEHENDIPSALEKIKAFALSCGLKVEYVDSRLLEIIKLQSPQHYQKLRML